MSKPWLQLRKMFAVLGVAASFVFAGASAAGIVDRAQHATSMVHEHGSLSASSVIEADHHADHHSDVDQPVDDDGPRDHHTGAGHHHHPGETSSGAIGLEADVGAAILSASMNPGPKDAGGPNGIKPGGLKRPPKDIANLD